MYPACHTAPEADNWVPARALHRVLKGLNMGLQAAVAARFLHNSSRVFHKVNTKEEPVAQEPVQLRLAVLPD